MKTIGIVLLVLMLGTALSYSQYTQGTVEMSLMGTAGSIKPETSFPGFPSLDSHSYFFLTGSVGYYLTDGLSLEPQFGLFAEKNSPPAETILLNLSYTVEIPRSIVAPFFRAGYGIGNAFSYPFYGNIPSYSSDKWDVNVWTAGVGLKIAVKEDIILKTEVNYRQESLTVDVPAYYSISPTSYTMKESSFAFLIGFSVLL